MKTALGLGFLGVVAVAAAYGLVRWTLNGAEEWVVGERNGHRTFDPITVRTDADAFEIADEIAWRAKGEEE